MADHPVEYHWSSYECNVLGKLNGLVTPQLEYRRLGKKPETANRLTVNYFVLEYLRQ